MFGFDWPELIIIGIVALIFIGPEDLPDMFRQLGRFTAKLRQMSREFSRAMEQAAKETGVSDVARDLKTSTSASSLGLDKVREAADKFEKWDPIKNAAKPTMPARSLTPPPMPATPAPQAVETSVADEVDDDLAAIADEPAAEPTIHGPATQALYDKQAMRARVLKEQNEKLRAIDSGTYTAAPEPVTQPAAEASKPAPRKRAVKTAEVTAVKPASKSAAKSKVETAEASRSEAPKKATRKKKADNA